MGGWRELHNEELHNVNTSPNIHRDGKGIKYEWREEINAHRIFVGKPGGKRPLGRPIRRLVDNIKMDLGEVG
jgi:hypothetical protein